MVQVCGRLPTPRRQETDSRPSVHDGHAQGENTISMYFAACLAETNQQVQQLVGAGRCCEIVQVFVVPLPVVSTVMHLNATTSEPRCQECSRL